MEGPSPNLTLLLLLLALISSWSQMSAAWAHRVLNVKTMETSTARFPADGPTSSFSYCLPSNAMPSSHVTDNFTTPSTAAGPAERLANGQSFRFSPLVRSPRHATSFYLSLHSISVAGAGLPIPPSTFHLDPATGKGGVILDPETSITRLSPPIYSLLRDAFRAAMATSAPGFRPSTPSSDFDTCFDLSLPPRPAAGGHPAPNIVPTIAFHFKGNGADLYLPPVNALVPLQFFTSEPSRKFCLAFAPFRSEAKNITAVSIGNVQQRGFRFSFDTRTSQLGFAPFQC